MSVYLGAIKVAAALFVFLAVTSVVAALATVTKAASKSSVLAAAGWWYRATLLLSIVAAIWVGLRSQITSIILLALVALYAIATYRWGFKSARPMPVVVTTTVISALMFTSAVVEWPVDLPKLLRPMFTDLSSTVFHAAPEKKFSSAAITYSQIRDFVDHPAHGRRISLILEKTDLAVDTASREATIDVEELHMVDGSRIITNGKPLLVRADKLIANNASIISFDSDRSTAANAVRGLDGPSGQSGGRLTLDIEQFVGELAVNLRGQDGGNGGDGLPGQPGAIGENGENGVDHIFDCAHGAGDGRAGAAGGAGGPGGAGGNAGDGGDLILMGGIIAQRTHIQFSASAGRPGHGGMGGPGGPGGPGGAPGKGSTYCRGGAAGPAGMTGPQGMGGSNGQPGHPGQIILNPK